jgi:hypothetical protein
MSNLSTLPKGDSAWLLRKAIERIIDQVSVLGTNIGVSTSGNSANTQIIFNDDGTLRGDAGLTYNKTTDALTVAGLVTAGSATITGDLTVDTNVLKVDSANNRVGVLTASPTHSLDVRGIIKSNGTFTAYINPSFSGAAAIQTESAESLILAPSGQESLRCAPSGVYTFLDGAGGTRMTLNSTGLGVGIAPQSGMRLSVSGNIGYIGSSRADFLNSDNTQAYGLQATGSGGNALLTFVQLGVATRLTLDASGNLLLGTTGGLVSSISRLRVSATGAAAIDAKTTVAGDGVIDAWNSATSGDNQFIRFWTEAAVTSRGSISYNRAGGLVAYNVTSDYRSKDIIGPVSNSGSLIDSLKVYFGKMHGATIERPMLIAHEAQEVAPYAVTGLKDEVDADGKDKYQQMDVSSFVPLLIAEIQSLRTRVQTLEAR